MLQEVILIHGKLVGIGPRPVIQLYPVDRGHNYAFYDKKSGEVWGQRIIQEVVSPWIYTPGDTRCPDLLLPYEVNQLTMPPGVVSFLCDHLLTEWRKTTPMLSLL